MDSYAVCLSLLNCSCRTCMDENEYLHKNPAVRKRSCERLKALCTSVPYASSRARRSNIPSGPFARRGANGQRGRRRSSWRASPCRQFVLIRAPGHVQAGSLQPAYCFFRWNGPNVRALLLSVTSQKFLEGWVRHPEVVEEFAIDSFGFLLARKNIASFKGETKTDGRLSFSLLERLHKQAGFLPGASACGRRRVTKGRFERERVSWSSERQ